MHAFMPWPIWSNLGWFVETYRSLLYMSINRTDARAGVGMARRLRARC